jgi:hypothetical protein
MAETKYSTDVRTCRGLNICWAGAGVYYYSYAYECYVKAVDLIDLEYNMRNHGVSAYYFQEEDTTK